MNLRDALRAFRFHPRLLDSLKTYQRADLRADLAAGVTVGFVALPLAMAFAIASGVKPEQGLITSVIAGFLISALGGSRVQIGGPAGAFVVLLYSIVDRYGVANLLISVFMAGVLLFLMGFLKLGNLIRFVPISVVIGFTNGIAVIIALSQVHDFLGLAVDKMPANFFSQIAALYAHLDRINPTTVAIGLASLALLVLWPKPAPAVAIARRPARKRGVHTESAGSAAADGEHHAAVAHHAEAEAPGPMTGSGIGPPPATRPDHDDARPPAEPDHSAGPFKPVARSAANPPPDTAARASASGRAKAGFSNTARARFEAEAIARFGTDPEASADATIPTGVAPSAAASGRHEDADIGIRAGQREPRAGVTEDRDLTDEQPSTASAPTSDPTPPAGRARSLIPLLKTWRSVLVKLPPTVLVLALGILAVVGFGLPVETIGTRFGGIPQGLPALHIPDFDWATAQNLVAPTISIALLGAIESLLCARVADTMIDDRHDPNQELMAQGLANFITPFFGGIAATGTIARTVTNVRAGARSPIAGMIHSLTLLITMLLLAPLAQHIPLASLAAILLMVAYNMGEWRAFSHLRMYTLSYRIILLSAFALTVVFDLTVAVEIGLLLACLFFIHRMSSLTRVEPIRLPADVAQTSDGRSVAAYRLFGSLFFGSVTKLEPLLDPQGPQPDVLVLELHQMVNLDTSGLDVLESLRRMIHKRGGRLILANLTEQPLSLLQRSGFVARLGDDDLQPDLAAALNAAASND